MKSLSGKKSNFLKSFLITFIIAFFVFTLARGIWSVLNSNPGGEDVPLLAEEMEMDLLVDEGSPFFEAFTNAEKVNVLALGVNGGPTDTIVLACLDTKTNMWI